LGADRGTLLADVSAEGVAAAIAWFLDHRDEAQVAAGRLRELVLRDYDVDTNAARLLELYRAVAAGSGPTAGRRPSSS
jgi:glycosyltransferase involved in cell wall biosynthesis